MKFGSPLLSTELSGALGGVVGATARGGVGYFRARVRPGNPKSYAQTLLRSIMTSLSGYWATTLTGTQRSNWEGISPAESSGIDTFIKGNMQNALAGHATVADAPASLALGNTPIATITVDASSKTIAFTGFVTSADQELSVYATRDQAASRLSRQFSYQYVGHAEVAETSVLIPSTHPLYNLQAGDVCYVRVVPYGAEGGADEGKVGTAQEFRCVVVA